MPSDAVRKAHKAAEMDKHDALEAKPKGQPLCVTGDFKVKPVPSKKDMIAQPMPTGEVVAKRDPANDCKGNSPL